jgi:hypothetical protein
MGEVKVPEGCGEATGLLRRAREGDRSCLPELRALLGDPGRGEELLEACGSPARWLEGELVRQAAGDDLAVREAAGRKLAGVREELAGPGATAIERLLAERAAVCWFLVHRYEGHYAGAEGLSIRQAEFHQGRIDRAHRRFLSALRALAAVRKLAVPAIRVNVGAHQAGAAGGG